MIKTTDIPRNWSPFMFRDGEDARQRTNRLNEFARDKEQKINQIEFDIADLKSKIDQVEVDVDVDDILSEIVFPNPFAGLTQGSVLFCNPNGAVDEDNANFFWDHINAQLELGFGAAADPSYSFAGDDDTGFYRSAANQIGMTTNGLLRATVGNTEINLNGINLDLNNNDLIFDTDGDSYIHASADDVVDLVLAGASGEFAININGAEDFNFTANSFNVLSSSYITMADDSWIGLGAAAGRLTFDNQATDYAYFSSCYVGFNRNDPSYYIDILTANREGFRIESTLADQFDGPRLYLYRNSASPATNDIIGSIWMQGEDSGGNLTNYAAIEGVIDKVTNGDEYGGLRFRFPRAGGAMTEYVGMYPETVSLRVTRPSSSLPCCHFYDGSSVMSSINKFGAFNFGPVVLGANSNVIAEGVMDQDQAAIFRGETDSTTDWHSVIFIGRRKNNGQPSSRPASGDYMFDMSAAGWDGGNWESTGRISIICDGATANNQIPARIAFITSPDTSGNRKERLVIGNTGLVAIGNTAENNDGVALLDVEESDTDTAATTYPLRISHVIDAGSTAANSIGCGIEYGLENDAGTLDVAGTMEMIYTNASDGNEDTDLIFELMEAGAAHAERGRLTSAGDFKITNDFYSGGNQGLSGTLTLDDGANWRITLTFTGGILTGQTTGASSAATATWV